MSSLVRLFQMSSEIHAINVEKGFWPEDRNFGEATALIISEAVELLAASWVKLDDKIPEFTEAQAEVADIVIRCLDVLAGFSQDDSETLSDWVSIMDMKPSDLEISDLSDTKDVLVYITVQCAMSLENRRKVKPTSVLGPIWAAPLVYVVFALIVLSETREFDLEAVVRAKLEYNKSRPFKHGRAF